MKRIIIHWTAGTYQPNTVDILHYHYLIDSEGHVTNGKYKPEDNLNCNNGKYAMHTGGGNTGSIGIAVCGMAGYINSSNPGKYPLTAVQTEALFKKVAQLCKQYNLSITEDTVLTHYEFGKKHPKTTSAGKIDITYLPSYSWVKPADIGEFIRGKVRWYLAHI